MKYGNSDNENKSREQLMREHANTDDNPPQVGEELEFVKHSKNEVLVVQSRPANEGRWIKIEDSDLENAEEML